MTATPGSNQLLAFIKFLRGRDIPVSPADTLDAVQAASLLGYEQRDTLRDGLAAVLAKSSHEELTYREAFDLFFSPQKTRRSRPVPRRMRLPPRNHRTPAKYRQENRTP